MISKIHSAIPYGFESKLVEVEGDMNRGLPAFNIVGMASKTINEARERVRSAIVNSGFAFPGKKVTINLAPADLEKDGSYLDLPIALSILLLSQQLINADVHNRLFVGELSLDGELRPLRGIINIVEAAKRAGITEIYLPIANLPQAALVSGIKMYGVDTLRNLVLQLKNQGEILQTNEHMATVRTSNRQNAVAAEQAFLDDVKGQQLAKRAIEIAIAGHHNLLMSGPPGAGKTFLAKVAANLLPPLTTTEMVDITKLYSIAGVVTDTIVTSRPFRHPHHTASAISIIGGGAGALPGEISLAHGGVLFLDELPEFSRSVLESLRQPLEDKVVVISRANRKNSYPADFMLIATMNPCPCGYLGDQTHECKCTERQIQNYRKKLSGPLMDRIDMYIEVEKVDIDVLLDSTTRSHAEHDVVKNNITSAIRRQAERYKAEGVYNGSLSSFRIASLIKLDAGAEVLLTTAAKSLGLSARSYFKTMKVARTIADLGESSTVKREHIAEALTFRRKAD